MNNLLPPAVDAARLLREAAFAVLLRERRPPRLDELAGATGLEAPAVRDLTTQLAAAGWLDIDDARHITGAAGLSLATGPHALTLAGSPFRTWCAYDALGIVSALAADALVETACGQCDKPISIEVHRGLPDRSGPELLWLAEGGEDLR